MLPALRLALLSILLVGAHAASFGISNRGTITSTLQSVDASGRIARSTAAVLKFLAHADEFAVCGVNPNSRIDNYYDGREALRRTWHTRVGKTAKNLGLSIHPHGECTRQVSHNISKIRDIEKHATFVVERLNASARLVAAKAGYGNWSTPTAFLWHMFKRDSIMCELAGFSGLRRNAASGRGQWYLKVGVTNEPETLFLPFLQRQYVLEHIRASVTGSRPVFERPANTSAFINRLPRGAKEAVTTSVGLYGGKPTPSQFYAIPEDEIVSYRDAYLKMEKDVDVSAESMLPSNIVILAMPIVLNFLPVALISGVGTLGVLLYVLVTDILTALPLAIKGFELLATASKVHVSANSFLLGHPVLGDAISEHWIARCQTNDRFRINGIIFLCCALFAIVLGISLELIAAKVVKHQKENPLYPSKGDLYMLKSGCAHCQCHAHYIPMEDKVSSEDEDFSSHSWSSFHSVRSWFSPWFSPRTPSDYDEPVYEYSKKR